MKYKIQTNLKVSKKGKIIASFKIEINSWNRISEEFKKILKRILIKILIRLDKKIKLLNMMFYYKRQSKY